MSRNVAPPPAAEAAPATARLGDGTAIDLAALAREVCRRYRDEFPDERERYGESGVAWCVHDNRHILNWAVLARELGLDLLGQVEWLARVLEARDFPLDRLARDLDIAAEVAAAEVPGDGGADLGRRLARAAEHVRSRPSFLE